MAPTLVLIDSGRDRSPGVKATCLQFFGMSLILEPQFPSQLRQGESRGHGRDVIWTLRLLEAEGIPETRRGISKNKFIFKAEGSHA